MHVKRGDGGGELSSLVREMTQQLKKMRIIDSQQMREMFLTYDCDRSGYIELEVRGNGERTLVMNTARFNRTIYKLCTRSSFTPPLGTAT